MIYRIRVSQTKGTLLVGTTLCGHITKYVTLFIIYTYVYIQIHINIHIHIQTYRLKFLGVR